MKIVEKIFDDCLLMEMSQRIDNRGQMEVFFSKKEMDEVLSEFEIKEQRVYKMPKKHTFFGIHYQNQGCAKGKLISVVQGRGLDYIVDLRKDSDTYMQYKMFELSEKEPRVVYVAPGFGHGFLSLEDQTIQAFAIDVNYDTNHSGNLNYKDPAIGLKLPTEEIILSDYDREAPFLNQIQ